MVDCAAEEWSAGLGVVVLGYCKAAADAVLENVFDGAAHGRGGLAGGDDEDAAVAAQVVCQFGRGVRGSGVGDGQGFVLALEDVLDGGEGVDCIEGSVEDGQDGAACGRVGGEDGGVEAGHAVSVSDLPGSRHTVWKTVFVITVKVLGWPTSNRGGLPATAFASIGSRTHNDWKDPET